MSSYSPGFNRSTKGASKQRRDLINLEIDNLKDLLPLPESVRQRLFQLQVMSMVCIFIRKERYLPHILSDSGIIPDEGSGSSIGWNNNNNNGANAANNNHININSNNNNGFHLLQNPYEGHQIPAAVGLGGYFGAPPYHQQNLNNNTNCPTSTFHPDHHLRQQQQQQQLQNVHHRFLRNADPCKALRGFLLMVTRQGKLLYISDNATDYLGHSVEEMMSQGDSLYDLVDTRDHATVQTELMAGPPSLTGITETINGGTTTSMPSFPGESVFICRMTLSRTAKRQLQYQKFILVHGNYLHPSEYYQALMSITGPDLYINPVFAAFCQPLITPENAESLSSGNTTIFTSLHQMNMNFLHIDEIGVVHLGYTQKELHGKSWYCLVHPLDLPEVSFKHKLLCEDKESSCILLVRLQTGEGHWLWLHTVLAVREGLGSGHHYHQHHHRDGTTGGPMQMDQSTLVFATYQILSDTEAATLQANSWIYSLPQRYTTADPSNLTALLNMQPGGGHHHPFAATNLPQPPLPPPTPTPLTTPHQPPIIISAGGTAAVDPLHQTFIPSLDTTTLIHNDNPAPLPTAAILPPQTVPLIGVDVKPVICGNKASKPKRKYQRSASAATTINSRRAESTAVILKDSTRNSGNGLGGGKEDSENNNNNNSVDVERNKRNNFHQRHSCTGDLPVLPADSLGLTPPSNSSSSSSCSNSSAAGGTDNHTLLIDHQICVEIPVGTGNETGSNEEENHRQSVVSYVTGAGAGAVVGIGPLHQEAQQTFINNQLVATSVGTLISGSSNNGGRGGDPSSSLIMSDKLSQKQQQQQQQNINNNVPLPASSLTPGHHPQHHHQTQGGVTASVIQLVSNNNSSNNNNHQPSAGKNHQPSNLLYPHHNYLLTDPTSFLITQHHQHHQHHHHHHHQYQHGILPTLLTPENSPSASSCSVGGESFVSSSSSSMNHLQQNNNNNNNNNNDNKKPAVLATTKPTTSISNSKRSVGKREKIKKENVCQNNKNNSNNNNDNDNQSLLPVIEPQSLAAYLRHVESEEPISDPILSQTIREPIENEASSTTTTTDDITPCFSSPTSSHINNNNDNNSLLSTCSLLTREQLLATAFTSSNQYRSSIPLHTTSITMMNNHGTSDGGDTTTGSNGSCSPPSAASDNINHNVGIIGDDDVPHYHHHHPLIHYHNSHNHNHADSLFESILSGNSSSNSVIIEAEKAPLSSSSSSSKGNQSMTSPTTMTMTTSPTNKNCFYQHQTSHNNNNSSNLLSR